MKYVNQIINRCCEMPGVRIRAGSKVVKEVLLCSPILFCGRLWSMYSKPVGRGIHEVWAERFSK